ncbi:MAG: YceG family protein [Peptoanaerobacter stomatis]|uniref:YceG family protein n=1 Tax=Peptoanaerobacter stomatis TaxID=796937 RepID=UPI003FA0EE6B
MYLREQYRHIIALNAKSDDIFEDVFKYPSLRKGYAQNENILSVPTFFYHIQGTFDDYEKKLLDFDEKLSKNRGYINLYNFNHQIDNNFIEKFNQDWVDIKVADIPFIMKNLSNIFVSVCSDIVLRKVFIEKFEIMLAAYLKQQLNMSIAKNSIIKILFLSKKYYSELMNDYYIGEENPKIMCYGQIYRDDLYFLLLMFLCSIDIIYFNPTRQEKFPFPRDVVTYIQNVKYDRTSNVTNMFVKKNVEEKSDRQETVAYRATQEIRSILHDEQGGIYSNWQFENYIVNANTIKATYDEVLQLNAVDARFRQGFEVENGQIYIPNIFAKISGVNTDRYEYFNFFDLASQNALLIETVPFSVQRGYYKAPGLVSKDGLIDKERIKKLSEYKFKHLRESVQDYILDTIQDMINKKEALFKFCHDKDIDTDIIYEILMLERRYIDLLQNFDYPYKIPRIVIFHDNETPFTKNDGIRVGFFLLAGLDIVIFTPSGYNDVELVINEFNYDTHKLDTYDSNLRLKDKSKYVKVQKKGFWASLFGN